MDEGDFQDFLEDRFNFSRGYGIGDDAAVINDCGDESRIITKDILIEDIHFKLDYFNFEELAKKALAVNLSDIAAMGGEPLYFFLGLGMPKRYKEEIFRFFHGIERMCKKYEIELAGGDYSKSEKLMISITMVGKSKRPILRKNAKNNDLIGITKFVGESALGFELLQLKDLEEMDKEELYFAEKHRVVIPELNKGRELSLYVNSMLDISDGLIKDLNRILRASQKGAKIYYDKIPISDNFTKLCSKYGINEQELVLGGGEDYGLLFTVGKGKADLLIGKGVKFYIIGEIVEGKSLEVFKGDKPIEIKNLGYDHFFA